MKLVVVLLLAAMVPAFALQAKRGFVKPEIARFAECGGPGKPCEEGIAAIKRNELAMLENGLPGHHGETPLGDPEKKGDACSGKRTEEEEELGLNPGASPCDIMRAKKSLCREEEECERNLVVEEENSEAQRAELQEMGLDKQVATLERLISHARDIQDAIPAKMAQLAELKKRLAAAQQVATAKKADGELERQRAFLLELNNKITELQEKLEELEMTKERTEKTIKELEEQANGLTGTAASDAGDRKSVV